MPPGEPLRIYHYAVLLSQPVWWTARRHRTTPSRSRVCMQSAGSGDQQWNQKCAPPCTDILSDESQNKWSEPKYHFYVAPSLRLMYARANYGPVDPAQGVLK